MVGVGRVFLKSGAVQARLFADSDLVLQTCCLCQDRVKKSQHRANRKSVVVDSQLTTFDSFWHFLTLFDSF